MFFLHRPAALQQEEVSLHVLGRRGWDKDGNYLKYKNTVDEKLEVQCFKASKSIVFQHGEQYYFKVKKDDFW